MGSEFRRWLRIRCSNVNGGSLARRWPSQIGFRMRIYVAQFGGANCESFFSVVARPRYVRMIFVGRDFCGRSTRGRARATALCSNISSNRQLLSKFYSVDNKSWRRFFAPLLSCLIRSSRFPAGFLLLFFLRFGFCTLYYTLFGVDLFVFLLCFFFETHVLFPFVFICRMRTSFLFDTKNTFPSSRRCWEKKKRKRRKENIVLGGGGEVLNKIFTNTGATSF